MLKIQFFFIFVQTNIFFIQIFRKIFFFKLRKKKNEKKRFFHFSHVITKFFIYKVSELHKKKLFENFFRFTMFSSNVWFHCNIFFFNFLKRNIFFSSIFRIKSIFQHFFVFWNSSSRLIFIVTLSRNKTFKHFTKKNRIASWSSICEKVYRRFVFVYKKFDIKECWDFAHFRKHTHMNATKK